MVREGISEEVMHNPRKGTIQPRKEWKEEHSARGKRMCKVPVEAKSLQFKACQKASVFGLQ